ncbi:hypothetical protein CVT25_001088 [Psilocybe cyanescens]|uniref:Uncharacterized protein n=1 Tax=Psilocybe cyanescens TaxID=93625 RepID=A0A409XBA3_PSICY|nr:hypothetical protein CVT25_001088 [Psilocybe cyanescens]
MASLALLRIKGKPQAATPERQDDIYTSSSGLLMSFMSASEAKTNPSYAYCNVKTRKDASNDVRGRD